MGPVSSEESAEKRTGLMKQPLDLELPVVAMGARPGDNSEKRELFTEETETVLVFENGCVIQLAAAVAIGQLIFLTNKQTGREIVTQVLRKRSHRPTDCYVELEFTEAAPNFWGQEFPDIETPLKMDVSAGSDAATVAESEVTEEDTNQVVAPPDAAEVERLRKEVEALRAQLKAQTQAQTQTQAQLEPKPQSQPAFPPLELLPQQAEPAPKQEDQPTPKTQETPAAGLEDLVAMQQPSAGDLAALKSLLGSKASEKEQEGEGEKSSAVAPETAKQAEKPEESSPAPATVSPEKIELMSPHEAAPTKPSTAPGPAAGFEPAPILSPSPKPAEEPSYPIRMQLPKAEEGGSQRTSEFAADSAAITEAQDEYLLPTPSLDFQQYPGSTEPSPKLFSKGARRSLSGPIGALVAVVLLLVAAGIMTYRMGWLSGLSWKSSKPAKNTQSAFPANTATNTGSVNGDPSTTTSTATPEKSNGTSSASGTAEQPTPNTVSSVSSPENAGGHEVAPVGNHSNTGKTKPVDKGNTKHPAAATHVAPTNPVVPDDGVLVPPKLVKAIKQLSPPEALRKYVSGKVVLDAVVDETGHVISATPISGPKPLYDTAIETVKQYQYLPATKGGKPVQAHVQVAIQFWYEP
jgi:hypothetical protein